MDVWKNAIETGLYRICVRELDGTIHCGEPMAFRPGTTDKQVLESWKLDEPLSLSEIAAGIPGAYVEVVQR